MCINNSSLETNQDCPKRKLNSYTIDFKLEAVNYWKLGHSKEATARKFGVDSKRIRDWCKLEHKMVLSTNCSDVNSKRRKLDGGGRHPFSETLELLLYQWLQEKQSECVRVTRKIVQNQALAIYAELEERQQTGKKFVASKGWIQNFFKRYNISALP